MDIICRWKKLFHLVYQYAKQIHLPDIVMAVLELLKKKRYGNTTNEWKINNISELKNRLSGWQLSSFEESYDFKIKNGISLAKHKMMNK